MRLRTIQLQNYRRYRCAEIEFPDGLVSVTGPNGAGKSTLLEAMAWALFGNQAEIVRTDKESIKRHGAAHTEQCMVRMEFDFEDTSYVLERTMRGKGLAMSATLHSGDTVIARGTEEVSGAVAKLFGMDHKAFFISVFARQKELSALTGLPKGDRKKMVLRLLGIESVDDAIKHIREDARLAHEAIRNAREDLTAPDGGSSIDKARDSLAAMTSGEKELVSSKSKFAKELKDMEGIHRKLKRELASQEKLSRQRDALLSAKAALVARIGELRKQAGALCRDLDAVKSIEKDFKASESRLEKATQDLQSVLRKKREALEDGDSIRSEMASLKAGSRQLEKEIGEIEGNMSTISRMGPDSDCPTCRRRLGKTCEELLATFQCHIGERREALKAIEARISEQEATLVDLRARSDALSKRETRLAEKLKEHEVLKARMERASDLRERLAEAEGGVSQSEGELQALEDELDGTQFDREGYERSRKALDELSLQIRKTERDMILKEGELALFEERCKFLAKELVRLEGLKAKYDAVKERAEGLANLEEIMGEFRKHLISRIRPALAEMSSDLMGVLTEGRYNEIQLSEDYEISVRDGGEYHGLERFSGGEKDLANLCLRMAISEIIATRHGKSGFDMIVLDEIFGSQDSNRKRALLQTLNNLSNRFKQIFLITHVEDIKELMGNVIQVSENPDGTSMAEVIQ